MRLARPLQLLGPVIVFVAIAAAEASACALSSYPSSEWLWYVNLRWFGAFQKSYYLTGTLLDRFGVSPNYFELRFVALPLLLCAMIGLCSRFALLLAIASNFSMVYIGLVAYAVWSFDGNAQTASLNHVRIPNSFEHPLLLGLILGCALSVCVSHASYIWRIRHSE